MMICRLVSGRWLWRRGVKIGKTGRALLISKDLRMFEL